MSEQKVISQVYVDAVAAAEDHLRIAKNWHSEVKERHKTAKDRLKRCEQDLNKAEADVRAAEYVIGAVKGTENNQ